jgi:hypothetical protein
MKLWHIITIIVVLIVGLCIWLYLDATWWARYKAEHNCQRLDETRTVPIMSCTSTTKSTTCIPIMVTEYLWRCDDGTEHWRSDSDG